MYMIDFMNIRAVIIKNIIFLLKVKLYNIQIQNYGQ